MAEQGAAGKDIPCIACEGNAEAGRTLIGTTPITEKDYRAGPFRVCKKCLRDPRIAAEKLAVKVERLKSSKAAQAPALLKFLEKIVLPAMNGLVAEHRLRINEVI